MQGVKPDGVFVATVSLIAVLVGDAHAGPVHVRSFGVTGTGSGQLWSPYNIAVGAEGSVYVTDEGTKRVNAFTPEGQFLSSWGRAEASDSEKPVDVEVDRAAGRVIVLDDGHKNLVRLTSALQPQSVSWTHSYQDLFSMGIGPQGYVYVYEHGYKRITMFTREGQLLGHWGSMGSGAGQFDNVYGITTDAAGNVYITDDANKRVQKFSAAGTFITAWGSDGTSLGQFKTPYGIATDGAGRVFVSDRGTRRVQVFSSDGALLDAWSEVSAGVGFQEPRGIAVGPDDTIWVLEGSPINKVHAFRYAATPTQRESMGGVKARYRGGR